MKHDTSIIIPAYNEAAWIRETLRSLRAHPLLRECQLIVVDDGSTDDTALLAASWADRVVRLLQNEGKGSALRRGIEVAEGQHFLFVDADLGSTAREMIRLLEFLQSEKVDMVIASPLHILKGGFGWTKRMARRKIYRLTGARIEAPLSGQRALTRRAVDAVRNWNCGFGIEAVMTLDILKAGLLVCELPLSFRHREYGRTLAGFWHRGRQYAAIQKAMTAREVR
ncbi:glycosyltransferase family 2 protein [Aneurinibacillus thermoaerophilus]|uniref:Glycosyl transferase family 2 n=3 Tax=Aneurinibacillus group TaxID=85151 RepID=A0A1G7XQV5_ANETH|nr:glycosyltransferase family 2 protein [Aneurinibacillus thermoaerophilus]AMA74751.1 hypothetical protein ACH33_13050 [Aneurinibacillus sp. XH2]MED0737929.1 glycosyltransferase family 2 protein [Aneurinibacillus thermoaerophilus]MED0756351.1 glycosyltransferase family 2 protein [Aneurinibacillus thermoaerophilus]MED0760214.1 glycosyltransferase family 2 protein [Aneurinibacillus thermoaerophilus]MED0765073.1 glycosyltransferase family 2 protein [Aneurinibacillus thermoaerophilus]